MDTQYSLVLRVAVKLWCSRGRSLVKGEPRISGVDYCACGYSGCVILVIVSTIGIRAHLGGDGIESACTKLSRRLSEDLGDFCRAKVEAIGFIG